MRLRRRGGPGALRPEDYPGALLARLAAHARAEPEREVCGLVVRDPSGALEALPLRNVVLDRAESEGLPESPRHAYLMDPREHLRIAKRLRREGGEVVASYHSHVEGSAEFSSVDRAFALEEGAPIHPGLDYIVLALCQGAVAEMRIFSWNGKCFHGSRLSLPATIDAARHPP